MMKERKRGAGCRAGHLTLEEHLWLHRQMERRARELWLESGGQQRSALSNWVQAEQEIWGEFAGLPASGWARRRRSAGKAAGWKAEDITERQHYEFSL